MTKKPFELPPLHLIEGFEASARHLSFTRAAAELFLTQSAVSRQIQALEERLGVTLFERRPRALALTEAGEALYRTVADVLRRIDETTRRIRTRTEARSFTVTTTPAFAALWLIPRLAGYTQAHPAVDVRISASTEVADLERTGIELAIRYSAPLGHEAGEKLFGEDVIPVCSPALLRDPSRPLREPSDLARHVLLHFDGPRHGAPSLDWPTWLHAIGLGSLQPAGTMHLNQYDQVVLAAVNGQGVAIGRMPLIKQLIRSRQLVAPFAPKLVAARSYYMVMSRAGARNQDVGTFVSWLRAEAKRETDAKVSFGRKRSSATKMVPDS